MSGAFAATIDSFSEVLSLLGVTDIGGAFITMATIVPIWIKDGKFNALTENEIKENLKEVEQLAGYTMAKNSNEVSEMRVKMEDMVGKETVDLLQKQFGELKEDHFKHLQNAVEVQGKEMQKLRSEKDKLSILKETPQGFMEELKGVWAKHADRIADYAKKTDNSTISFELKTQVARSAVSGNTMAQDIPGVGQIPRRMNAI